MKLRHLTDRDILEYISQEQKGCGYVYRENVRLAYQELAVRWQQNPNAIQYAPCDRVPSIKEQVEISKSRLRAS